MRLRRRRTSSDIAKAEPLIWAIYYTAHALQLTAFTPHRFIKKATMVNLNAVRESNSKIASLFPEGASGVVAVFAGATGGIGESTLKHFAEHVKKPKVYFLGRNENAGSRITTELKTICPEGDFTFIKVDLSLIANVDEVCTQIKSQETHINLLFLTSGVVSLEKKGCLYTLAFWGTSLTGCL